MAQDAVRRAQKLAPFKAADALERSVASLDDTASVRE
jgi:hypothetical protein